MDFSYLESLQDEEIKKMYSDAGLNDLISECYMHCGCTYAKGSNPGNNSGYDSSTRKFCCPSKGRYASGSDNGNCAYTCRILGLVDWFYG